MTTTHTPGPWWLDDDGFVASGSGETYLTIADPHCAESDIDEREANARLIAAAPDLLAAAIDALETFERRFPDSPTAHDLRAAIARATGKA